jgi:galactosamine-6-phosphate isomerase
VDQELFAELSVIKLDEWGGVPENDPVSSESYLQSRLLQPLGIPARECERIGAELARRGPIDMCVLGLGINGHVGFNEPGPFLMPHCHVAQLSEESRRHAMVRSKERKPDFGLTLGMQEILASRRIVLLVAGEGKQHATARLMSEEVTTTVPASFLWLHGNVDCVIDRTVLANQDQ